MIAVQATHDSELERAIERATVEGIIVLAQGQRKRDGARLFWTNSHSDPHSGHIVLWAWSR